MLGVGFALVVVGILYMIGGSIIRQNSDDKLETLFVIGLGGFFVLVFAALAYDYGDCLENPTQLRCGDNRQQAMEAFCLEEGGRFGKVELNQSFRCCFQIEDSTAYYCKYYSFVGDLIVENSNVS